jgi:hypothetical protein
VFFGWPTKRKTAYLSRLVGSRLILLALSCERFCNALGAVTLVVALVMHYRFAFFSTVQGTVIISAKPLTTLPIPTLAPE